LATFASPENVDFTNPMKNLGFNTTLQDSVDSVTFFFDQRAKNLGFHLADVPSNNNFLNPTRTVHTKGYLERAIAGLSNLANVDPKSFAVFYFTGHSNGSSALCLFGDGDIPETFLYSDFQQLILKHKPKVPLLLILDTCFSGDWVVKLSQDSALQPYPIVIQSTTSQISTAGNGFFSTFLTDCLKGSTPPYYFSNMLTQVRLTGNTYYVYEQRLFFHRTKTIKKYFPVEFLWGSPYGE